MLGERRDSSALGAFRIQASTFDFWLKATHASLRTPTEFWPTGYEVSCPRNRHTELSETSEAKTGL